MDNMVNSEYNKVRNMKTIKIFVASSEELKTERLHMADLVEHLNYVLRKSGLNIQLVKWEYVDSSMGIQHKQEEYNNTLKTCELCLVLYYTRFGNFTKSELDTAYNEFCAGNNPRKIYVYFKDCSNASAELQEFRDSFPENYGHFFCRFENIDTLKADFLLQLMEYLNNEVDKREILELRDGKVLVDGKEYVDLKQVSFAGNNEKYKLLLKNIDRTQKLLSVTDHEDPEYTEYVSDLKKMKQELSELETNLWDTALFITHLSTQKCSERLQRAMQLFNKGDNNGAMAILKEEDIEQDVQHNLNLISLGEEGKKGLLTNIDEYRLKIKVLHCSLHQEDYEKIIPLRKKVLDLCVRLYGERSINVAEEHCELAKEYQLLSNYNEAQSNYEKSIDIQKNLELTDTLGYADTLRGLGRLHVTNEMYLKGKPYLEQALAIIRDKFGENNPIYVKSLRDMSVFYRNMDFYDDAIESASKALEIAESLQDIDKSLYNSIKRTLAIVYSVRKIRIDNGVLGFSTTKDKNDLSKAINLLKEVYNSEIEDKKASIYNLYLLGRVLEDNHGWQLKNNPKLIEAADYYTKALTIAKEIDDKDSINKLLKTIGSVFKNLGTPEKAEALGYSYPKTETNDNKTLSETVMDYREKLEKTNMKVARIIADLYLEKFPRKLSYEVELSSTEDDSETSFCYALSNDEIDIIKKCSLIASEEECSLDEILSEKGHDELVDKLVDDKFNIINSVDLNNPLKFTKFSFQQLYDDGTLSYKRGIGTDLTDDEFKEILIELLLHVNRYSMNMLVYRKPELAQNIMRHLAYASFDYQLENWNPYIADMFEHKDICEKILNPFKDILNIFHSENEEIKDFAYHHQIVPDDDNEIYTKKDDSDWFHCIMNFYGTRLDFMQEGVTGMKGRFHDVEAFSVEGKKLMEKFSLKDPKEILPYLKEHYNTPDCFYRIKKEFEA